MGQAAYNTNGAHIDALAALFAAALLRDNTPKNPFEVERQRETAFAQDRSHTTIITSVKYAFDSNGDFLFRFEAGSNAKYAIVVKMSAASKETLNWTESRTLHILFLLCERFNKVTEFLFIEWSRALNQLDHIRRVHLNESSGVKVIKTRFRLFARLLTFIRTFLLQCR